MLHVKVLLSPQNCINNRTHENHLVNWSLGVTLAIFSLLPKGKQVFLCNFEIASWEFPWIRPTIQKKVPQDSSRGIKVLSLCNRIFHMFDDKTRILGLSQWSSFLCSIWDMEPYCRGRLSGLKSAIMASLQLAIQNRLAKIQEAHNLQRINPFFQLIVMLQLNRKIYLEDIHVFRILNDWGLLYESRSKKKVLTWKPWHFGINVRDLHGYYTRNIYEREFLARKPILINTSTILQLILFADDTNVFVSHKDKDCLTNILNAEQNKL